MSTYRTVVVGVHNSSTGRRAVELAAPLSSESGAKLVLVAAYGSTRFDQPQVRAAPSQGESFLEPGAEAAELALKHAAEICKRQRISEIETVAVAGDPVTVLTRAVRDHGADLLLVGSHGLATLGGRLLGSVPGTVTREADCDVLVVHTTRERRRTLMDHVRPKREHYQRTVMVGVHQSQRSMRAVEKAGGIAADFDAELVLVGVYEELERTDYKRATDTLRGESHMVSGTFPIESVLRDAEAKARARGANKVEPVIVRGDAMKGLLKVADKWSADILVLGNHQLSGRGAQLIGSISDQVTRKTATHVLLVH